MVWRVLQNIKAFGLVFYQSLVGLPIALTAMLFFDEPTGLMTFEAWGNPVRSRAHRLFLAIACHVTHAAFCRCSNSGCSAQAGWGSPSFTPFWWPTS